MIPASLRLDALFMALLPFSWLLANHYYPWASAWQEGMTIGLLLMAVVAVSRPVQWPRHLVAVTVVVAASLALQVSSGRMHFAGDAWMVMLYVLSLLFAVTMGTTLTGPDDRVAARLDFFCAGLLMAALLSAGIGFAQWAGVLQLGIFGAELGPGARPYANFGQPNHWCTASFIGLCAAWWLYEARRIQAAVLAMSGGVLMAAMVMSGSRTAWLQIAAGLVIIWLQNRSAATRLKPVAALLAATVMVLAWLAWPMLNADASPGVTRSIESQATAGLRWPLWQMMAQAIWREPWAGYGWQQMSLAQQAMALQAPALNTHFEHAHNIVLDLLVWAGMPVAATILVLVGWFMWTIAKRTMPPRAVALWALVAGVLAHSMVEYPIEYAYFLLPLGVVLGALFSLSSAVPATSSPSVLRGLGLITGCAFTITVMDYLEAEKSYRQLRLESARIGTVRIESTAPSLRVLDQLEAFQVFARREARGGMSASEVEFSRRVVERFAYPPAQFRHAQVLVLNGDGEGAAKMLRVLCAMHPAPRCHEAIEGWTQLQSKDSSLADVPLPSMVR